MAWNRRHFLGSLGSVGAGALAAIEAHDLAHAARHAVCRIVPPDVSVVASARRGRSVMRRADAAAHALTLAKVVLAAREAAGADFTAVLLGGGADQRAERGRREPLALVDVDGAAHARRIGDALPGDVERRAVIGGGADDREAGGDVHADPEPGELQRDQSLVMVHREDRVIAAVRLESEERVGGEGALHAPGACPGGTEGGADHGALFGAEDAVLARVGIETKDGYAGGTDRKVDAQSLSEDREFLEDPLLRHAGSHVP